MEKESREKNFFYVFTIYFVVLLLFVLVRIASGLGWFSKLPNDIAIDAVSTAIIQIGIMFLVPFFMYMALFHKNPKQLFVDFGYKKIGFKAVLVCIGLGVLGFVINIYVSSFFSILLNFAGYNYPATSSESAYSTFPKFLFGVLSTAIMPAICEEFLHRGLLLRGSRRSYGYKFAIVTSSICFGLMHLNIQQFFFATVLGLLMAVVDLVADSIYPSMIMHFCNNFFNVLLSYLSASGISKFSLSGILNGIYSTNIFLFFALALAVLVLCVWGFYALTKQLHKVSAQKQNEKKVVVTQDAAPADLYPMQNVGPQANANVLSESQAEKKPRIKNVNDWFSYYIGKDDSKKLDIPLQYKIPYICCLFMAIMVTSFTFIWGVV